MAVTYSSYRPKDVEELLSMLTELSPEVKLHAGGTDLMVHLKDARIEPESVVDISGIQELDYFSVEGNTLLVGALAPFFSLIQHPLLDGPLIALREASVLIGSVQIRNRATLAGNICNASPAADTVPPLVVYGAEARLRSQGGRRSVPVVDFITGPGTTALEPGEFVEAVAVPVPQGPSGSAYLRMTRRRSVDLAIVDVAVVVTDREVRVSYGAASARPARGTATEEFLTAFLTAGKGLDEAVSAKLQEAVHEDIAPISDVRGSKEYRSAMAEVLVRRAFALSRQRRDASRGGKP